MLDLIISYKHKLTIDWPLALTSLVLINLVQWQKKIENYFSESTCVDTKNEWGGTQWAKITFFVEICGVACNLNYQNVALKCLKLA